MRLEAGFLKVAFAAVAVATGILCAPVVQAASSRVLAEEHTNSLNNVMINPTSEAIRSVTWLFSEGQIHYVAESARDMNLPKGLAKDKITEKQREAFINLVASKYERALVSSPTLEVAIKNGLPREHAAYFVDCKNSGATAMAYCISSKRQMSFIPVYGAVLLGVLGIVGAAHYCEQKRSNAPKIS